MGLVEKLLGATHSKSSADVPGDSSIESLADDAIDTLGCIIRTMGEESFPLEGDTDASQFPQTCSSFAAHVENGAAVPSVGIEQTVDGTREWGKLRRFYIDRRQSEKRFVAERLRDYRGFVEDLVGSLKQIGQRDQELEQSVINNFELIEKAIGNGALPEIKASLGLTLKNISESFAQQKEEYEAQISDLNNRMSNLRQDLVEVREEMKRDPLTDAFNRGAFDTAIAQSLNLHLIVDQPVTLILIDIDNFKGVNDNYGHAAGDQVLRSVSDCLARSFIRKSDLVARFGGDEFAVILNDTAAKHAAALIERFMKYLTEIDVTPATRDTCITCSVGFTEVNMSDSVESVLNRADEALYEAKESGRNTARMAASPAAQH